MNPRYQTSKLKTPPQCWFTVGPSSATLAQHWVNVPCLQGWWSEVKNVIIIRVRILAQVTIYRRLQIGRDGHLDQSEAYDIVTCTRIRPLGSQRGSRAGYKSSCDCHVIDTLAGLLFFSHWCRNGLNIWNRFQQWMPKIIIYSRTKWHTTKIRDIVNSLAYTKSLPKK